MVSHLTPSKVNPESPQSVQTPRVSIVIPTYNGLKFLPQTIASVMAQTFQNFELLLIDDGSSDGTSEWVAQFNQSQSLQASSINRIDSETTDLQTTNSQINHQIRFFQQQRGGVSAARNLGIQNAVGEFVAFLDADDLWVPTKLARQINYLMQHPQVGLVHGWIALMDEAGTLTGRVLSSRPEDSSLAQLMTKNSVACQTVMVRRSCFDQAGVFDRKADTVEDWDVWMRVARFYPIAVLPEVLAQIGRASCRERVLMPV